MHSKENSRERQTFDEEGKRASFFFPNAAVCESQSRSLSHFVCAFICTAWLWVGEREQKQEWERPQNSEGESHKRKQNESQAMVVVIVLWPLWLRLAVHHCTPSITRKRSNPYITLCLFSSHKYSNIPVRHGIRSVVEGDREHLSP